MSKVRSIIEAGEATIKDIAMSIKCDASYLAKLISGKRVAGQDVLNKIHNFFTETASEKEKINKQ